MNTKNTSKSKYELSNFYWIDLIDTAALLDRAD